MQVGAVQLLWWLMTSTCFVSLVTLQYCINSATTVTLCLDLHEWKDFGMTTTFILIFKFNSDWSKKTPLTLSEGLNPKVVSESGLLLKCQRFVAEKMEGGWLTFLLCWLFFLNFFDTNFRIPRKKRSVVWLESFSASKWGKLAL